MKEYTRTDLALEKRTGSYGWNNARLCREERLNGAVITEISVPQENEKTDTYVTVAKDKLWDSEEIDYEILTDTISKELRKLAVTSC